VGECGRMVAMIVLEVVVCIKVFVSWCRFIVHEAALIMALVALSKIEVLVVIVVVNLMVVVGKVARQSC